MFVVIADQTCGRHDQDHIEDALRELAARFAETLALPPERTAGDELQLLTDDAETALEAALMLLRDERWRVGIGVGSVRTPLPASVREAHGEAFTAARAALITAAKRPMHCAVRGTTANGDRVSDLGSLIDLLLSQRARWSEQGWELHDLLAGGDTQADAAERIGITPQAASKRARAAGLRLDTDVREALARLLGDADQERAATLRPRDVDERSA